MVWKRSSWDCLHKLFLEEGVGEWVLWWWIHARSGDVLCYCSMSPLKRELIVVLMALHATWCFFQAGGYQGDLSPLSTKLVIDLLYGCENWILSEESMVRIYYELCKRSTGV